MLTPESSALFEKWSNEKRLISIVVRTKNSFFRDLEEFCKPEDVALVALVSEKTRSLVTDRGRQCFDLILFFDPSRNTYANVQHFDDVRIPDLEDLGHELKSLIDMDKLQLIYGNESSQAPVCNLRQKLGLNAPYLTDLAHIRNKNLAKDVALRNGIPTAKSFAIDFSSIDSDLPTLLTTIERTVGGYPMFKRPTALAGCQGAEKIPSRKYLHQWIQTKIRAGDEQTYLIEEYLTGREFLAVVCLLPDGHFEPLVVKYLEYGWSNVLHIESGRPVPIFVDSFHNCTEEFPQLANFVKRVVNAFKPPAPQVFCVQGFQRMPKSDDYVLVELAHRPAGSRTNSVCYKSCGISQETALLMSHIDPEYRSRVDPYWKRPTELALWFPQRKGILVSYTPLPDKENVKSEIEAKWLKPLGSVMDQPTDINKHVVILTLQNEDRSQLLQDAKWIADHWSPVLKNI